MSVYSLVFSPTGGTQKVMNALTAAFGSVTGIDLSCADTDFGEFHFGAQDLCFIGIPVFEGRVPRVALDRLFCMTADSTPTVLVAVFGNRDFNDALLELSDTVISKGFISFAGVSAVAQHSILPMFGANRPDDADRAELAEIAARIQSRLESGEILSPAAMPGNRPYISINAGSGLRPGLDRKNCTQCGLCAQRCPVGAITGSFEIDVEKCIRCMRCASICPTGARFLPEQTVQAISQRMEKLFAERKSNRLYMDS